MCFSGGGIKQFPIYLLVVLLKQTDFFTKKLTDFLQKFVTFITFKSHASMLLENVNIHGFFFKN